MNGGKATHKSDIALALFVMAVAAMLLIPLPTPLLDFLLVLNISFSLLLLLVGLYMPNALALLAFPSLLLLTTLFRLGLNVASTRLVLSEGYAGRVIEAFGTFLIRGEIVVGVIIFAIVTIVNFIVIARGASRVSEVAARFALDALPGKQMAIDSDVRSGLITAQEAQRRREDLRKESQLYGAMDGSMRFVQGDAIAGFFIIFTNIIGGLYLGLSKGQSFPEAVVTYTTLTVGDGLVSQIPAILISICAGIVVTRVSSGENTTLGGDVGTQLFTRPTTLLLAGSIVALMGLLPGLPALPFLMVAALFFVGAAMLRRSFRTDGEELPVKRDLPAGALPTVFGALGMDDDSGADETPLLMSLDSAVLYRSYRADATHYRQYWNEFRADFQAEVGIRLPDIQVVSGDSLGAHSYALRVAGTVIDTGALLADCVLVEVNPESAQVFGFDVVSEGEHPVDGSRVFWALDSASLRTVTEAARIRTFDFFTYLTLKIATFARAYPEEFVTLAEVHSSLKQLEKRYPGLLGDSFNREFMTVARFTELAQELVRQGISIRDIKQLVEAVALYCSTRGAQHVEDGIFDLQDMISFIRVMRKRQLMSRMLTSRRTLKVVTLSTSVEEMLVEASDDSGKAGAIAMEPQHLTELRSGLRDLLAPLTKRGLLPVSILCRSEIRQVLSLFLGSVGQRLGVITFEELDPLVDLEQIGVWTLPVTG